MTDRLSNIKHISLDFWNTVAVPNKEYAKARTVAIRDLFCSNSGMAQQKYSGTKKFFDTMAELAGFGTTSINCWKALNAQFKTPVENITSLMAECIELFKQYPPTIPTELPGLLVKLRSRGVELNILSNTNFIPGVVLKEHVLLPAFGEETFGFALFSDEWSVSKPSPTFYQEVVWRATFINPDIKPEQILHIGDHEITDVKGATAAGLQAELVTDPADLVCLLKELLNESV